MKFSSWKQVGGASIMQPANALPATRDPQITVWQFLGYTEQDPESEMTLNIK